MLCSLGHPTACSRTESNRQPTNRQLVPHHLEKRGLNYFALKGLFSCLNHINRARRATFHEACYLALCKNRVYVTVIAPRG